MFLNLILNQKEDDMKKIYNPNINYELFIPCSNELSKRLKNLIKNKNKSSFEELILFLVKNNEAFKIINDYYPYDNTELKSDELKYANYYIYYLYHLYKNKINFSIRIKQERYDIIFPEEDQVDKYNPYFILNEENSLYISKGSFIKHNNISENDNNYEYFENSFEEDTKQIFEKLKENFDGAFCENLDDIEDLELKTSNFFMGNQSSLISRISSLVINLTDKYSEVIDYCKDSCNFLEADIIEIFQSKYQNLQNLNELLQDMNKISFFCESSSTSMLWKYRNILTDIKIEDEDDKYYTYFKSKEIIDDNDIKKINQEITNINELNNFFKEDIINNYKNKLFALKKQITSYKNEGKEDPEITKLRNNNFLIQLQKGITNKAYSTHPELKLLKEEISKFSDSNNPTKEIYELLQKRVKLFIKYVKKEEEEKFDTINLPNKARIIKIIDTKKLRIYKFIFWYSLINENLEEIFDFDTPEDTYKNILNINSKKYNKKGKLDPIIEFIREKKLQLKHEQNFSPDNKDRIKQMLRGILLLKMKNKKINLDDFNKIVEKMNSRINPSDIISMEEYYFSYIKSDNYPKNKKIRIPIFTPMDALFVFYKYDKNNIYKLSDLFSGINKLFAKINEIAQKIIEKEENYKNMVDIAKELAKSFYYQISGDKLDTKKNPNIYEFLKNKSQIGGDDSKILYERIASGLDFIESFQQKILNKQEENKLNKFEHNDFKNLLDENNRLMTCSEIFERKKKLQKTDKTKSLFSHSFIFYINNNKKFIDGLFADLNKSKKSIIFDLNNNKKIDCLPFWLYILRNVSSLNCLEYGYKEIDLEIAKSIVDKIKIEISSCLISKKPLNLKWYNLLGNNISSEIYDPKLNLFYNLFNKLITSINLSDEFSDFIKFIKDELKKYFLKLSKMYSIIILIIY